MPYVVEEHVVRCYTELAESEEWKPDHEDAMACIELERLLKLGVWAYDSLVEIDEKWREEIMSGKCAYEETNHRMIRELFERWSKPCARIETSIRRFEDKGYVVDGSQEFRKRRAEAHWILSKPEDAFASPRFTALRDAAAEDQARGLTQPM